MSNAKVKAYAQALFAIAQADGAAEVISSELYAVARAYESSDALRNTLGDATIPSERRLQVVEQLLGTRANRTTVQIVSMIVASGQVRELPAVFDEVIALSSADNNQDLAEVRSAIALTEDQQSRLAAALSKATGKAVNLKVVVDPSVIGGLVATVGDKVIDDTVRTRLDNLKTRI
jgi:F-type H+-transporting ATPase subunit delta